MRRAQKQEEALRNARTETVERVSGLRAQSEGIVGQVALLAARTPFPHPEFSLLRT